MNVIRSIASATVLLSTSMMVLADEGDAKQGNIKAQQVCAACHGVKGLSTLPTAPNLAGQPRAYLEEQMKQYRSGKRMNEMMSLIAKPLSDQEILDTAAWYASIQIEVK